ncbi:hypothetical protein J6590_087808, partial [Homalodisca vitripennis]
TVTRTHSPQLLRASTWSRALFSSWRPRRRHGRSPATHSPQSLRVSTRSRALVSSRRPHQRHRRSPAPTARNC